MDYERLAYCCRERSKREMEDATQITLEDAATAITTLQAENEKLRVLAELGNTRAKDYRVMRDRAVKAEAENEKLRAELEYEEEHANAYYEECGQWEAENTQLKEKLEALKQDRDAIEQDFRAFAKQWWEEDIGFPCRWCKFERQGGCEWKAIHPGEICAGRAFEWRGQQKED